MEELIYSVKLNHNSESRIQAADVMPQPDQCAVQMIDGDESLRRGDPVQYLKVEHFNHRGRIFTAKPFRNVRSFGEVNMENYVRNLITALLQTLEPMVTRLDSRADRLTNWLSR